jgi:hypothetical protein
VGAHAKHLKNLYIYFWRWATWKVFGSGNYAATGNPDEDEEGIVCFIMTGLEAVQKDSPEDRALMSSRARTATLNLSKLWAQATT